MCVHMHMNIHGEKAPKLMLGVFLSCSSLYILRKDISLNLYLENFG